MKTHPILSILSSLMLIVSGVAEERAPAMIETVKMFAKGGSLSPLFDELAESSVVIREGTDEALRPVFVNAQADFERAIVHWLKTEQIEDCLCIIHTPVPATPLCTNGEISTDLVDPAIASDPERLFTVRKRPDILRKYLQEGGRLLAAYPKNGRKLRSTEQLAIFDELLQKYPRLEAIELDCEEIPHDLIGATYLIRFSDSEKYVLSIRSYQANSPADGKWAMWFGSIQNPAIAERLEAVTSFLEENGFSPF